MNTSTLTTTPKCFSIVPSEVISIINNQPRTTSLKVAEVFGKLHKNVLRAIDNLDCSTEFRRLNFELCHKNSDLQNGKPQPYHEMTKDGFMFLVMGFTGKQAARIKEAYIAAFNWMADQLFNKPAAKSTPDTRTPLRDAVSMLVGKKHLMYPEAYAIVHQRFGVEHIDQLAADQIPQAVEYVHRLVLDGEWMPAQKELDLQPQGYVVTPSEAQALSGVLSMVDMMRQTLKEIDAPLRALGSKFSPRVYDSWHEIGLYLGGIQRLRNYSDSAHATMIKRYAAV
jgi:Rha family phage regulatory protein